MRLFLVLVSFVALNFQTSHGQVLDHNFLKEQTGIQMPTEAEVFDWINHISQSILEQYPDVQSIDVEIEYYVEYSNFIPNTLRSSEMPLHHPLPGQAKHADFDIAANPFLFTEFVNLLPSWSFPDCTFAFQQGDLYPVGKKEIMVPVMNQIKVNPNNFSSLRGWGFMVGPGDRFSM